MTAENTDAAPVMLVVGGSRGIGAATVTAAARAGYDVAFTYVSRPEAAEEVAAAAREAGRRALALKADAGSETDILAMFEAVDGFGPLSAVVYNSGVTGAHSMLADAQTQTLRNVIGVNLIGALIVARESVRRLSKKRGGAGGSIVFVSSRASAYGSPGEYVWYAASKGGVDSLTIGLAREVAGEGVRVNAVAPGPIATDMHRPGRLEEGVKKSAFGRAGAPQEVAEAILFLVSDKSPFTTGAILNVSGGA